MVCFQVLDKSSVITTENSFVCLNFKIFNRIDEFFYGGGDTGYISFTRRLQKVITHFLSPFSLFLISNCYTKLI